MCFGLRCFFKENGYREERRKEKERRKEFRYKHSAGHRALFLRLGHMQHPVYGMQSSFIRKKYSCDLMSLITTGLHRAKQVFFTGGLICAFDMMMHLKSL